MLSCSSMSYDNNFIYTGFLLYLPGGLVKPVVEDDIVDVVDVDRGDHGFMLFDDGNVVVSVLDEVDVSWMEDINITV